jgi:hypothetical protein
MFLTGRTAFRQSFGQLQTQLSIERTPTKKEKEKECCPAGARATHRAKDL